MWMELDNQTIGVQQCNMTYMELDKEFVKEPCYLL